MSEEEKTTEAPPPPPVEEVIDYKDKYLRLLAETENMRKRMQKEKQETMRYTLDTILATIITPMDSLESALKCAEQMSAEVKNWAFGFQMILGQFKEVLEQNHVVPFNSEGEQFDPHKHEAVESEENNDVPPGTILKEFVKGYKSGERIIRPARVKVSIRKEKTIEEEKN